jgi:hypothetical protein
MDPHYWADWAIIAQAVLAIIAGIQFIFKFGVRNRKAENGKRWIFVHNTNYLSAWRRRLQNYENFSTLIPGLT